MCGDTMRTKTFDEQNALNDCMIVFWEKGYKATSISDLEVATGLLRTSLYNAFEGKQKIFALCIERYIQIHCQTWVDIIEAEGSTLEVVENLFTSVIEHNTGEDHPTSCLIAVNAVEMDSFNCEVQMLLKKGSNIIFEALFNLFSRGNARGEFKEALDNKALAMYIICALQGIKLMGRSMGTDVDFMSIANHHLDYLSSLQKGGVPLIQD